jgi:hypothetical protein
MPIRINLLAEAQMAEELRRKDPVKRAIFLGGACVAVMGAISLVIQSQVMSANRRADGFTDMIGAITNEYRAVMENSNRLAQLDLNRRGLDILASERFLNGSLLNALQQVYVDNVQLVHLRTEHNYTIVDEARAKTTTTTTSNTPKVVKPATAAERIVMVIEARDTSLNPGDQVTKFKEELGKNPHFLSLLGTNNEIRLVNLSPPQVHQESGKPAVQFTLESRLPEKVRLGIESSARVAPNGGGNSPKGTPTPAPKAAEVKL